jgi:hypothetical protein
MWSADLYFSRIPSGTVGYLAGTNGACYKMLQDLNPFPGAANARCQHHGGKVLTFTNATEPVFRALLFPPGLVGDAKAIAGYTYTGMKTDFKDADGKRGRDICIDYTSSCDDEKKKLLSWGDFLASLRS